MALIGTVILQPNDKIDYDVDVSALVDGGDAIASIAVTVTPPDELVVSAVEADDETVKLWIGKGGVAGTTYKVEFVVTTDLGREKEDEIKVKIKDY